MLADKCEGLIMAGELIGEVCAPSEFIAPVKGGTYTSATPGEIWLSGNELWWYDGSSLQQLSGTNTGDA